jgi:cytochrome c oxidase subunit II
VANAPRLAALATLALLTAGCDDDQSTLSPRSDAARRIANLWWAMFAGAWIVFAVVVALLAVAIVRRRAARSRGDDARAKRWILVGGFAAPVVVLSVLFGFAVRTLPATSAPAPGTTALTVEVTGHQWWWEVRYAGSRAVTANEIHIPAATRVRLVVRTVDVIHSFWVPQLNRKIDLIPGKGNELLLRADRPGVYRGQCAEFCGVQHAHMAFLVVAEAPARFRAWLTRQARPAPASQSRGRELFLAEACSGCHTIRGTTADGTRGPDLTHVGSRTTLAALALRNDRASLERWIRDPQHVKPGAKMPALPLSGSEVRALADYLEGLR